MSRVLILLSASLLLLNGCGRTVSTGISAYLKPSTSSTLADKNRHDLMASSHLENRRPIRHPRSTRHPSAQSDHSEKVGQSHI